MKYIIKYSPDAKEKLIAVNKQITDIAGNVIANKKVSTIVETINGLKTNPQKGQSVAVLLNIITPYRFLHVEHNYIFYKISDNVIEIVDIYNEREDFMWKLFGIKLRTEESKDYWGE